MARFDRLETHIYIYGSWFSVYAGETSADVIKTNVLARIRPSLKPDGCPGYVVNVIKQCWTHNPEKRPDFPGI